VTWWEGGRTRGAALRTRLEGRSPRVLMWHRERCAGARHSRDLSRPARRPRPGRRLSRGRSHTRKTIRQVGARYRRLLPEPSSATRCQATQTGQFPGSSKTGATGLEPATSGVTGRVGHHDAQRRTPLNRVICRSFFTSAPHGCQSCDRRLGHEWAHEILSPWTTPRRAAGRGHRRSSVVRGTRPG